jgi:hypothetical protein
MPKANAAVRMKRVRRVKGTVLMMRIPDTATEENKNVVIPPRTAGGIAVSAAANLEKMPMIMRKKQQAYPALRFAQRVRAITPLFWANVDMGVIVALWWIELAFPIPEDLRRGEREHKQDRLGFSEVHRNGQDIFQERE